MNEEFLTYQATPFPSNIPNSNQQFILDLMDTYLAVSLSQSILQNFQF